MNEAGKIPSVTKPARIAKVVKQRNHDGGHIPSGLAKYAGQPLYMLIALWCWKQKRWVDHKTISAVFGITERRASFQLSYLTQKSDRIQLQVRMAKAEGAQRVYREIWVERVKWRESRRVK